jgi:hypothetical protein
VEGGLREYDIPHQKKTGREAHAEGDDKSGYMGFKNEKAQIKVLFVQDKIIAYKKNKNIEKGIGAAACRVSKSLNRHEFAKRRVEKINKRYDPFFRHRFLNVEATKVVQIRLFFGSSPRINEYCTTFAANKTENGHHQPN